MKAARLGTVILMLGLLLVRPAHAGDTAAAFEAGKSFTGAVDPAAAAKNGGHFTQGAQTFGISNLSAMSQARGGGPDLAAPPEATLINSGGTLDTTTAYDANPPAQWVTGSANTRPLFKINPTTDPLLKAGHTIKDNPEALVGKLDETYSECTTLTVTEAPTYEEKVCQESRTVNTVTCDKILTVACDLPKEGCDPGGIVPTTLAADMAVDWAGDGAGNYILTFGTIADNYWGGRGAVYDRRMTFDIRDVGQITRFALTRAAFDDWLLVSVNGTVAYVGPLGGDRLEVVEQCAFWNGDTDRCGSFRTMVQYCANCYRGPELSTSWNISLSIDLKPYLRDGSNTIFMRTIVADGGEGAIQITTRQLCPRDCHDSWTNQCVSYEALAQ